MGGQHQAGSQSAGASSSLSFPVGELGHRLLPGPGAGRGGAVGDAAAWGDADAPPLRAGLGVLTRPRAAPGLGRCRSLP